MATQRVNQQAPHMGQTSEYYLALYTKCKPIQIVYDKWLKWKAFIFKSSYSIVCVPKIVINLAFIGEQLFLVINKSWYFPDAVWQKRPKLMSTQATEDNGLLLLLLFYLW